MNSYSVIEKIVNSLHLEYDLLDENNVAIDVNRFAKRLNISIQERSLGKEISGLLIIKEGKVAIGIESDQGEQRKRFTIAHELGHFFLHREIKSTFVDEIFARSNKTNQLEREANAFAASLLMPEALIKSVIDKKALNNLDDEDIKKLSDEFNVSQISMTYRLINLKIIEQPFN